MADDSVSLYRLCIFQSPCPYYCTWLLQ